MAVVKRKTNTEKVCNLHNRPDFEKMIDKELASSCNRCECSWYYGFTYSHCGLDTESFKKCRKSGFKKEFTAIGKWKPLDDVKSSKSEGKVCYA